MLGATYLGDGTCRFCVWAPLSDAVELHIISPRDRLIPMDKRSLGYHSCLLTDIEPGAQYLYRLRGEQEFPDPASKFQPEGVHGPSQVVDPGFPWKMNSWCGIPLSDFIIYEIHVGAFTAEGTFDAAIHHLNGLKSLGITALELMPVAQFPGERNWGYDGVYPFAVQNSYGGPEGLKRLVDACHVGGLAVILDVVNNHLGPEGNYVTQFGPYFTSKYRSPWGEAINFDGPHSDEVRNYFIQNALYWIEEFRIDALRIDAVHGFFDFSSKHFLQQLAEEAHDLAHRLNRRVYLIAESDLNDSRVVRSPELCGYGLDAQWNDDFHHALHVLLTGERTGYYADFGLLSRMAKAFLEGYVYTGDYSVYRSRSHGNSSRDITSEKFVVFSQNHDQIGNRVVGERLAALVDTEALKLAAGVVILSPFIPLLFMGEEYAETAPFPYFVSHTDSALVEAVREGRCKEFSGFGWHCDPPDPQSEETFLSAKLDMSLKQSGHHKIVLAFYNKLISLRKSAPIVKELSRDNMNVVADERHSLLLVHHTYLDEDAIMVFHFGGKPALVTLKIPTGRWRTILDSAASIWGGPGRNLDEELESDGEVLATLHPYSLVVLKRKEQGN